MNIEQLYQDYGIRYATEGHKHCREGWVNTECPFCQGNAGLHLGYNTANDRFVCWRCGGHGTINTLSALLHKTKPEVFDIVKTYNAIWLRPEKQKTTRPDKKKIQLPPNLLPLSNKCRKYLKNRGFLPTKLEEKWGLKYTGPHSIVDKINYKYRIFIPYYWNGEIVSYDNRDITNQSIYKYMACSEIRETISHKEILYGLQECWGDVGICVEGCADVWRMGVNAFAVSGIKYTPKQVREIAKRFKKVIVMFDNEPQAKKQADKLIADLKFRGIEAYRYDLPIGIDPADLTQQQADKIVKKLLG